MSARYGLGDELGEKVLDVIAPEERRRLAEKRRFLETTTASEDITDPVMCIHEGDIFIFEIEDLNHYPVYQKDSLINSNPSFDYGAFKILAAKLASQLANLESGSDSSTLQYFGYTFSESGTYHFADSEETEKTMIITVMTPTASCPDEEAFLMPKTQDSLSIFGVSLETELILQPDYVMLVMLILTFLFMMVFILILTKWVGSALWHMKAKDNIPYRKKNRNYKFYKMKFLFQKDGEDKSFIDKSGEEELIKGDEAVGDLAAIDSDFVSDDEEPGIDLKKL